MQPISSSENRVERIGNLLAYNVSHAATQIGRTRHIKALFFADMISYNLLGRTITGDTYYPLPHGPVGTIAGDLTLGTNPYLQVCPSAVEFDGYFYEPRVTASLTAYTPLEKVLIEGSRRWVEEAKSATQVSDVTHSLPAWKEKDHRIPIPEKDLLLDDGSCDNLRRNGIGITPFLKEFCTTLELLRKQVLSQNPEEIEAKLIRLTQEFSADADTVNPAWKRYEDGILACLDAVRDIARFSEDIPDARQQLVFVCEKGLAFAAALVFARSLPEWVWETTEPLTEFFDAVSWNAVCSAKEGESVSPETDEFLQHIFSKMHTEAVLELNQHHTQSLRE